MPIKQIAHKIHKSESATHERIKALKKGLYKGICSIARLYKLHKIELA